MALEQRLQTRLQQKLVMTPALQLAIKLLQLNKLELEQTLQEEMVANPVLEEDERRDDRRTEAEAREEREPEPEPADTSDDIIDNLDTAAFFEKYFDSQPTTANMREESEAPSIDATLSSAPSLVDHLAWQLEMSVLEAPMAAVTQAVLGNLDDDGYVRASVEEIAAMDDWHPFDVERGFDIVQRLDPPGIGARDLRECLFLQLESLELAGSLAATIVCWHLDDLRAHRFKEIARALGTPIEAVGEAVAVIRELNPRPGQAFSSESPRYIVPDVFVRKDGDEYVVSVNDDGLPKLRVSRLYRNMLQGGAADLSKEASEYLQDKVRAALWLIKSYGQRQRTIAKVAESIVVHQRDFLERGVVALRPMVLRDVAEDIEMHESTVSRVVNGKYMHTPQGIFEMRYFFHSGLGHSSGADVSSVSVKDKIRRLIDAEDERKPLSDAALARRLKDSGLQIARRTVAKYREELHIPASKARRAIG